MTNNPRASQSSLLQQQRKRISLSQLRNTSSILFQQPSNPHRDVFKKIIIRAQHLNHYLKINQWRNAADKPIVHCEWTCILPVEHNKVLIQTKTKYYPFTLKDINKISLTQIMHILREILGGFEVLYQNYGSFEVFEEFIYFDENFNIEVWCAKDPSINNIQLTDLTQHEFLCSILKLVQNHGIKSNLANQFNLGLKRYEQLSFDTFKCYFENFITRKQLLIANKKSFRQVLTLSKNVKQLLVSNQKNIQKSCSLNFIYTNITQQNQVNADQADLGLMFSPSKKTQHKRMPQKAVTSVNILKESDITTIFTDKADSTSQTYVPKREVSMSNISSFQCNQYKKSSNYNYKSHLNQNNKKGFQMQNGFNYSGLKQKQWVYNPDSRMQMRLALNNKMSREEQQGGIEQGKPSQDQTVEDLFSARREAMTDRQNHQLEQQFQEQGSQVQYRIQNRNISHSKQTPEKICQPAQKVTIRQEMVTRGFGMSLQTQQSLQEPDQELQVDAGVQEQPNADLRSFLEQNSNFPHESRFFVTLESLAQSRQMTSSIQIGRQIPKQSNSPVKLQKLDRLKLQTCNSIIQDQQFMFEPHHNYS